MTFQDIQKITWGIADIIRDKGNGETTDYMKIGLPMIFLKRVLDIRAEYVKEHIMKTVAYKMEDSLIGAIDAEGQNMEVYLTKDTMKEWYFITWEDILNFGTNPNAEDKEIKLSGYKENITITSNAQTRQDFIEQIIHSFKNVKMNDIFEESEFLAKIKTTKVISESTFTELILWISKEDFSYKNAPSDIFSDAYMDLIEKFAEGAGKKGGEFFTPRKLCEGVVNLLDPELPESGTLRVCDITSGSATFLTVFYDLLKEKLIQTGYQKPDAIDEINNRVEFYLQEKNAFTLIMGEMNLLLAGMRTVNAYNANSISEYINNIGTHRGQMDYFVGNPPYGLKDYGMDCLVEGKGKKLNVLAMGVENRWDMGIPMKGEGEFAFMNTFMDMLNSTGRGALVLPLGTLFKDSTKEIRKKYLENDWVEGLILLPASMFTTTSIPVVIWVFNKAKEERDTNKVFMINASEDFVKEGKFNVWNQAASLESYLERKPFEDFSDYISLETLRENDYNLSVQRYVFKEVPEEEFDLTELLSDVVEIENGISEKSAVMDDVFSQIVGLRG